MGANEQQIEGLLYFSGIFTQKLVSLCVQAFRVDVLRIGSAPRQLDDARAGVR